MLNINTQQIRFTRLKTRKEKAARLQGTVINIGSIGQKPNVNHVVSLDD